jgi:hypothetical protein
MSDTATRTIPVSRPTTTTQAGPGAIPGSTGGLPWLARHKVDLLATGAALAVTAAGVRARDKARQWAAEHPQAAMGAGALLGGATGAALSSLTGLTVEPLVIEAADRMAGVAGRATGVAQHLLHDTRALSVAGGALTGAAAGALLGQLVARQAPVPDEGPADDPDADEVPQGGTQVPEGWRARLKLWADHRAEPGPAEPQEGEEQAS